eukprot:5638963-Amphidinium_carterae.1
MQLILIVGVMELMATMLCLMVWAVQVRAGLSLRAWLLGYAANLAETVKVLRRMVYMCMISKKEPVMRLSFREVFTVGA